MKTPDNRSMIKRERERERERERCGGGESERMMLTRAVGANCNVYLSQYHFGIFGTSHIHFFSVGLSCDIIVQSKSFITGFWF